MKTAHFIFIERTANRYSINALCAALEGMENLLISFSRNASEALKTAVEKSPRGISVICFSFSTAAAAETLAEIKSAASARTGRQVILAGGPHPSALPEEAMQAGADFVLRGESEEGIRDFASEILSGGRNFRGIRGLCFKTGKELKISEPVRGLNLDSYPPVSFEYGRFGPMEISRGCPHSCAYCQTPFLFGPVQRHRDPDSIIRNMERMMKRGFCDFRFITPDAFSYGSSDPGKSDLHAIEYLLKSARKTLGKRGRIYFGSFPSEVRPERISPEILAIVRKYADNKRIIFGAQSGSPGMLLKINRSHGTEAVLRAASLCSEYGFVPHTDFIFGLPGETREDAAETLEMIRRLADSGARIHLHYFMPLPGTPLAAESPSPLSPETLKTISSLVSAGKAYGQWENQMAARKAH